MINPISTYLAVCHTNLDGVERIEVGKFYGYQLKIRGKNFCASYQDYGLYAHVEDIDFKIAIRLGKQIAEHENLPFVNTLSGWD